MSKALFFIGIIPHTEILDEVQEFKHYCKTRFDSSKALNSPAHITLIPPFKFEFKDVNNLVKHLNDKGIPCGVYYPIPLHRQKAYLDERYKESDFEVTNQLVKDVISLPMHTELDDEQMEFITSTIIKFING